MILSRIGPLSLAKIAGVLYGALGLFVGCVLALFSLAGGVATEEIGGTLLGALFGAGAVIFMPILYGGFGFVGCLLMAALYNVIATLVGGVEVQLDEKRPTGR